MALVLGILGLLCIVGGVSVMLLNSGTTFFAVWYALGAILLAAGWAVHAGMWAALPAFARRAIIALVCIALAVLGFTQTLILSQIGAQGEPDLDYVVVLGAQIYDDGSPSPVLKYRLDAALDYLQENPRTKCIVSGGQGHNEPYPEADGMARYLHAQGISEERILLERTSTTTRENIANSMELMDSTDASVGVVTNNFHVYRAMRIARKAGLDNACGIAGGSTLVYLPNNLFRESLGLVKDFAVGNI